MPPSQPEDSSLSSKVLASISIYLFPGAKPLASLPRSNHDNPKIGSRNLDEMYRDKACAIDLSIVQIIDLSQIND